MTHRTRPIRTALGCCLIAVSLALPLAPSATASPADRRAPSTAPAWLVTDPFSVDPDQNVKSTNWTGFADHGRTFKVVRATWRQPRITCGATDAIAAFWVGLDGYRSSTVEQDGSLAYCHNGKATYYTWWEMYPRNHAQLVHSGVQPGDKITATVFRKGAHYNLKVVDHTHPANSFVRKTFCAACQNSSAEWITERVSSEGHLVPLAKFQHVLFVGAHVATASAAGSIGKFPHDRITMVNGSGLTVASTSPLKKHGKKFISTWHRMQ